MLKIWEGPPTPRGVRHEKNTKKFRLKNSIFPFEFPLHTLFFSAPAARFVFVPDPETEEMFGHELPPRKRKRDGSDSDSETDEDFSEPPRKRKKKPPSLEELLEEFHPDSKLQNVLIMIIDPEF